MAIKVSFSHPDDAPLSSSLNEVHSFRDGLVWADIQVIVKEQIEERIEELKQAGSLEEMKYIQGQLRAWELVLELPDQLEVWINDQGN